MYEKLHNAVKHKKAEIRCHVSIFLGLSCDVFLFICDFEETLKMQGYFLTASIKLTKKCSIVYICRIWNGSTAFAVIFGESFRCRWSCHSSNEPILKFIQGEGWKTRSLIDWNSTYNEFNSGKFTVGNVCFWYACNAFDTLNPNDRANVRGHRYVLLQYATIRAKWKTALKVHTLLTFASVLNVYMALAARP